MASIVEAIKVDLRRLHEAWMELVFPRQLGASDTVFGKYTPDSSLGMLGYRIWGVLGGAALSVLYPLAVLGFATRYYVRRVDSAATRLGLAGVVLLTALVWGGLTVVSYVQFDDWQAIIAVGAASGVATLSSALSVFFARVDGRPVTVLLAYPFAVTAIFLPPVVAAFYSPTLASIVFPGSESIAEWVLDNLLSIGGIAAYLRNNFELTGAAYVGMWFGISFPIGWFFGTIVTLANVVRPSEE